MTDPGMRGPASDPLQALRDELAAVTPSPAFAARVRQELDLAGREQAAQWVWGKWLGVAAATVVLVIGVASAFRPSPLGPTQEVGNQALELLPAVAPQPERETARAREPEHPSTRPEHPSTPEPENPSTRAPENPDLVVITNQPAVLRALWARARAGAALVEVPAAPRPESASGIVVAPIEVHPIVVPWMVEPPASPGSSPIIR